MAKRLDFKGGSPDILVGGNGGKRCPRMLTGRMLALPWAHRRAAGVRGCLREPPELGKLMVKGLDLLLQPVDVGSSDPQKIVFGLDADLFLGFHPLGTCTFDIVSTTCETLGYLLAAPTCGEVLLEPAAYLGEGINKGGSAGVSEPVLHDRGSAISSARCLCAS